MITSNDIQTLATLAHIHINDTEIENFSKNVDDVLAYVGTLQDIDTTGYDVTEFVFDNPTFREDEVITEYHDSGVMACATVIQNGAVSVPKVL